MKKLYIFTALLLTGSAVSAQSTLYSEDFEGATTWDLNTGDAGSTAGTGGDNQWLINNQYTGGSAFVCIGTITAPPTTNQPSGITGYPNSTYLHVSSTDMIAGGVTNANFLASDGGLICAGDDSHFAAMPSDISTVGYSDVAFNFWWLCGGAASIYGKLYYSTDGGSSWASIGPNLFSGTSWAEASVSDAAFEGQATIRFGFMFINNSSFSAIDPGLSIDQITITGSCFETNTIAADHCAGETVNYYGTDYTATGVYTDTIPGATCDTVVTLDLNFESVTTTVSTSGTVLTADHTGAGTTYQWVDCDDSYAAISGATSQSYDHGGTTGNYACIVTTAGGCSDTTECVDYVNTNGLTEGTADLMEIYPNPFNDELTIENVTGKGDVKIVVYSASGQVVKEVNVEEEGKITLDMSGLETGTYIVRMTSDSGVSTRNIVKQ